MYDQPWDLKRVVANLVGVCPSTTSNPKSINSPTPHIIGLGELASNNIDTYALSLSDDGTTVVGNGAFQSAPFKWTREQGLQPLCGFQSQEVCHVNRVSRNGTIAVGSVGFKAVRWNEMQELEFLGSLGGDYSEAVNISADRSTIVGAATTVSSGQSQAFRWNRETGMQTLDTKDTLNAYSVASGVSEQGDIIVGTRETDHGSEAFYWNEQNGMQGLGYLPGGDHNSFASAVSANGNIVVGHSKTEHGSRAFLWTPQDGMHGLGALGRGNTHSFAWDVTDDGSTVVGTSNRDGIAEAFIWNEHAGIDSLSAYLKRSGADLSHWLAIDSARAISSDGRWITGSGINVNGFSEGFIVDLKL